MTKVVEYDPLPTPLDDVPTQPVDLKSSNQETQNNVKVNGNGNSRIVHSKTTVQLSNDLKSNLPKEFEHSLNLNKYEMNIKRVNLHENGNINEPRSNNVSESTGSTNAERRASKISTRSSIVDPVDNIPRSSSVGVNGQMNYTNNTSLDSSVVALNGNQSTDATNDAIPIPTVSRAQEQVSSTTGATVTGAERHSFNHSVSYKGRTHKSNSFQKATRRKSKVVPDDRFIIPQGERIEEGHSNYIMAYNMITGIRTAVSRCSKQAAPIKEEDYYSVKKLIFDVEGSQNTPSTKYDFKFKDYSPEVFRRLRQIFRLDPADYLVSLTENFSLTGLGSPGKSGSFFYYSRDYRFIIKTIHHTEHRHLRKVLKDYYQYVEKNPDTFLCQFYGLHRLKMYKSGKIHKIYFIVMNNLFPPHKEMHQRFDLKGSTLGRVTDVAKAKRLGKTSICCKDLNWLQEKQKIHLGPIKGKAIMKQLTRDIELLERMNIMDYSLLIGIHDLNKAEEEDPEHILDNFGPITVNKNGSHPSLPRGSTVYLEANGGVHATDENNKEIPILYFMGVIDCLTNYSTIKHLETLWRSLSHKRETISAVPPVEYGKRFLKFIGDSID